MDGIIILDKPTGWTSHDAVNKVRRLTKLKKVGHLGTLDPLATGVLPLVIGRATRLAQFFTKSDKAYEGIIRFGFSTDTYDCEGEATSPDVVPNMSEDVLRSLLSAFRGRILQTPPPVSAKKIGGVPAYRLARKNQPVELKPVEVMVHSLELVAWDGCDAKVVVHCSTGTYLRAIAHDLGRASGFGAHILSLRRTKSGSFGLDEARTIADLERLAAEDRIQEAVIPSAELLPEFPTEPVDAVTVSQIRQGRDFRVSPFHDVSGARYVKAISDSGDLVAIGEARLPNLYHPILVL